MFWRKFFPQKMSLMDSKMAREVLLRHAKSKQNGLLPQENSLKVSTVNEKCGDQVEIALQFSGDKVISSGFSALACAVCTASASIWCGLALGKDQRHLKSLLCSYTSALQGRGDDDWPFELDELLCFQHLCTNATRRECALLPVGAFLQILDGLWP